MSITHCPTCHVEHRWSWTEAFDKFGFDDGDGIVMTEHVARVLRAAGYTAEQHAWGCHNVIIVSIKTRKGKEVLPESANVGYDDPRDYLPKRIIAPLDRAFPEGEEVEL